MSENILYELSESQKSIWYLEKAHPGTSINIVAGNLRLDGDVDYQALEQAINSFVKNNDSMRIRIVEEDGSAFQYVEPFSTLNVDFLDFSKSDGLKALFAWDEETTRKPFDICNNQLYYCALFKINDDEGGFYMKMHHLISDAWTMGLATRQVINVYSKIKNGIPVDEAPKPSYLEHLQKNAEYEASARFEKDRKYWAEKFETLPEMTALKAQKQGQQSIRAKRKTLITPAKLSKKIREFSSENRVSVFTMFMSALAIYINRVTGIEDVVLGTTILNRVNKREKDTTGMFVSVAAPIRISVSDSMNFRTFAQAMLRENTNVLKHQKYPYNYLLRDLKKSHKMVGKLFDIVLSYQNSSFRKSETNEAFVAKWLFSGYQIESLVISINDREDGGNLIIDYDFLTDVFSVREIEFIHQHILRLLWHALDNPEKRISKLEMISEKEKHTILHDFNDTAAVYPADKTIHQIFEEQVQKTPDSIALKLNDEMMTYRQLNENANRLARTLRAKGIGPDDVVGLIAERSFEMIISIFGILKAGGAYMPIDPGYPTDRKEYMLNNSSAKALLAKRTCIVDISYDGLIIDLDGASVSESDGSNLSAVNKSSDLAYIIYTSGSTGRPKGVMIEHKNLVGLLFNKRFGFDFNASDVWTLFHNYCFDFTVWEMYGSLLYGGKLIIITPEVALNQSLYLQLLKKERVTILNQTPQSMYNLIDLELQSEKKELSIRRVFMGGEALKPSQLKPLKDRYPRVAFVNLYGPTESTIFVTYKVLANDEDFSTHLSNIGTVVPMMKAYVLDSHLNLLPIGTPGELYVSGNGVSRGYINNQQLTAERFISNPFEDGEVLYKTGDLVRLMPLGDIIYLGRTDSQVKIRGYRIELGEIENALLKHPNIQESVLTVHESAVGSKMLCAYYKAKTELKTKELTNYLAGLLPSYMIPSVFVKVDSFPMNRSGKIDKTRLPEPYDGKENRVLVTPQNATEIELLNIWTEVLGTKGISVLDDFFFIGGDSLNALKVAALANKYLNIELSPRDLFQYPTIRELAEFIAGLIKTEYTAIRKVKKARYYAVSSTQKRQYILNRIDGGVLYNMPGALEIDGEIDIDRLKNILEKLAARHETLRTSFELSGGEPVQIVHDEVSVDIEYLQADTGGIDALMASFVRPFELSRAPLLRVGFVRKAENSCFLLFDMHHIISDGASVNILIQEFTRLYAGEEAPALKIQYRDYAVWHNAFLQSDAIKKQEDYWLERFSGEIPILNMPTDSPRPSLRSGGGNRLKFIIDETLTRQIKKLAADSGATLFMVLMTAYSILLSKYTGQEDVVVGTPVEGRRHADLQELIGMFVNTLAIRSYPEGGKLFSAFLSEIKEDLLSAYENQDYPFEQLVDKVCVTRDVSRNPLFDTMFVLQSADYSQFNLGNLSAQLFYNTGTSKFDLLFEAVDKGETIAFDIEYDTDLFELETIERLAGHYMNTLKDTTDNPAKKLCEITILSEEERRQLLLDFNDTDTDYPRDKTLHQIFEEQVSKTPDNVALVFDGKTMTYGQLNASANRLGHTLRQKGVGPDTVVGLIVYRSFEMLIAIFGVLKAGGAYMPIDPAYPQERKAYMLENSGAKILLLSHAYADDLAYDGLIIDLDDASVYSDDYSNLEPVNTSSNLAYIIYTSGSTGRPKGVMIEHRNLVGLLFNDRFAFDFNASDVWTLFHSYCFDFTVWEMYGALLRGGKLIIITRDVVMDQRLYLELLQKEGVTVLNQTPQSMYNLINLEQQFEEKHLVIRYVFLGGEALKPSLLKSIKDRYPQTMFTNLYGPTESTIFVTLKKLLEREDFITNLSNIGAVIPLMNAYVLDKQFNLMPIGVPGELYVSGNGISRGYINNAQLTAERFVDNPFEDGTVLYKTGDLVKMMPKGDIVYLGRTDSQVKIRGYRIELGEIETQLLALPGVSEAVVIDSENELGSRILCAYYSSNERLSADYLKDCLSRVLPTYMIPSFFVFLDQFPLTSSGKINYKALPQPFDTISRAEVVRPVSKLEKTVAEIWEKVLGFSEIGVNESFFELGGTSLNAVTMAAMLNKQLGIEISTRNIFEFQTVKMLSEFIGTRSNMDFVSIPTIAKEEFYPVSSAQKRQYILKQIEGDGIGYNVPFAILLKGHVDTEKLESAFKKLVMRHESLRTSFELRDGEPVQIVHDEMRSGLEYLHTDDDNIKTLTTTFIRPFDLSRAPLFRVGLASLSENRHVLLFDIHHIITDGASSKVLIKELGVLYKEDELPVLEIQYKDYAAWHNALLQSDAMKEQEAYWLQRFNSEVPVLNLPLDYTRPTMRNGAGDRLSFTIDKKLTKNIKKLAAETEATLFMVLMTAYNILLSKYTGQEDIVVGTPVAGRRHADLHNLIGMFVNTLAVRSYPDGEKTLSSFLTEVKDELLDAFENQDYPFEELVDKAGVKRDVSRNPLFDTMLILQESDYSRFELGDLSAELIYSNSGTSKFDLTLDAVEQGDTIAFDIEYDTALFKRETIERMGGHFINALQDMTVNPLKKLKEITILSKDECHALLVDFNRTDADFPQDKMLHQIFEEQAAHMPDNVALVLGNDQMTYRQLNEQANRLARTLQACGVRSDTVVGLAVDRSFEMVIAMLGVLKAGGAYMPMDPDYPVERKVYMLENSGAKVLLTKKAFDLPFAGETFYLDDASVYNSDASNLEPASKSSNLAYVIYTSGSTGRPKGVMTEHRNVVGLLFNDRFVFDIGSSDVSTLFHSYCFDLSCWELYNPLLRGGKVIIIPPEIVKDASLYLELLRKEKVTLLTQTPQSMYNLIQMEMESVQNELSIHYVVLGGEALNPALLRPLKKKYPAAEFFNQYGPTETTLYVTQKRLCESDFDTVISNIGVPNPMTKAYVTDQDRKLVPVGVPGELCVSGNGVSRGYINNPELTRQKFIDNPFSGEDGPLYTTGDLVKLTSDGEIVYLGRIDNQVKIRGYRIELGEIESVLLEHDAIEQAIAVAVESNGGQKLCAYYKSKAELSADELASFLLGKLPEYMIPSLFVRLDIFPLNSSGKVDKAKLPRPSASYKKSTEYAEPRNLTETLIANVWAEVLELPAVGLDDDFFELGGDSLSAVKVISKLKLGIRIVDFYTSPTVRLLAEKLSKDERKPGLLVNLSKKYDPQNVSVICFPYGGGSALAYKDLSESIRKKEIKLNVYAVNLPGHDLESCDELKSFEALAAEAAAEISAVISDDIILFGHSVGSALALETARILEKSGRKLKAVFITGFLVPRFVRIYGRFYKPWCFASNARIIHKLQSIGLAEGVAGSHHMESFLKAYRHDAQCVIRYFHTVDIKFIDKVNAPMYFIVGDKDPATKRYKKKYMLWKKYFNEVRLFVLKDAEHFFINTHADRLADYLTDASS